MQSAGSTRGSTSKGDILAVATSAGLAIGVFDLLVGYAIPGGKAFPFRDHLASLPEVVLLASALVLMAWAPLSRLSGRRAGSPRNAQLGLAVAAIAAFWTFACLRTGKPLESEPALAISGLAAAAAGLLAHRILERGKDVPLHPRNLLLPALLGGIALGGLALDRALASLPGERLVSVLLVAGLAALALRTLPTRRPASDALRHLTPAAVAILSVAALLAAQGASQRSAPRPPVASVPVGAPRHVVLITVDTLRADALGRRGDAPSLTPRIDAFAAASTSFARAYSRAPWTMPSVASILTGVSPLVHGVVDSESVLPSGLETLAEAMARSGYRTAAFGWNPYLNERFGFDQGFHEFFVVPRPPRPEPPIGWVIRRLLEPRSLTDELPADALDDLAIDWAGTRGDAPFFLWLHYFDPHAPYAAHPDAMNGRQPPPRFRMAMGWKTGEALLLGSEGRSREERAWVKSLYDAEVQFLDGQIGRLFDALRRLALYDDALIVLTADHGQEFWEHGRWGHGQSLYQEQIRVPLIVKLPGQTEGQLHAEVVTNESVVPTILSVCRIDHDPGRFTSNALLGGDGRVPAPQPILSTATHSYDLSTSIVSNGFKYIRSAEASRERLFDLTRDPRERHDEAYLHPDRVAELRAQLKALTSDAEEVRARASLSDGARGELDEATRAKLRELGYLR
jgi:arylsulfatase A-like enzyme